MLNLENSNPSIKFFADVAYRYCTWAEGEFRQPQEEMRHARQLLAELHLAAISLPDLDIIEREIAEKDDENASRISNNTCSSVFQKFRSLPIDKYWDVFNPLEETQAILSSLADDLADIYREVKRGLVLFESNHSWHAAWEWRFSFQSHWGHHLVGAQRAIHEFLADENL